MSKTEFMIVFNLALLFICAALILLYRHFKRNAHRRGLKAEEKFIRRIAADFDFSVTSDENRLVISSVRQRWTLRALLLYLLPCLFVIGGAAFAWWAAVVIGFIQFVLIGFYRHASFYLFLDRPSKTPGGGVTVKWVWLGLPFTRTLTGAQLQGFHVKAVRTFVNGLYSHTDAKLYNEFSQDRPISWTLPFRTDAPFIEQANQALPDFRAP